MYRELIVRSSKGVIVILLAGAMATLLHSESRRLYSWWWDSHNTPKNSKWLQDNLTDIDAKVKTMIKLIEEDADSFARRAEMYYKKRPELMKLVEEFYRAYRALAERYNHTTGELRHAHRTIARAFPDQVPQELIEDSSSPSKDKDLLHALELQCPADSLFNNVVSIEDMGNNGLKQLSEMFEAKESVLEIIKAEEVKRLRAENQSLKERVFEERERAERGEVAMKGLEKELFDVEAEKENFFAEYQRCLEKLSTLEEELASAEEESMMLNGESIRAEIEIHALKEGLVKLEAEKNDELKEHDEYLTKISHLEAIISQAVIDMKRNEGRESEAEAQALALKGEVSQLKFEKESVVDRYKLSLENISDLESVISARELEAKEMKKRTEEAETEASELRRALAELHKEKEASAFKYKCCLEEIAKLEKELSSLRDEIELLKANVRAETAKLKTAEDNLRLLEMSNRSLQSEASDLSEKILKKDLELSMKQEELVMVQTCLEKDQSRHAQIETTLKELQNLHAQSREDQKVLAVELNDVLRMLEDMRALKQGLESEIKQVRDENRSLSDANLYSASSLEHMQDEVFSLREIKERLEREVAHHISNGTSLQKEIIQLKEDIKGLSGLYGALIEQVEASGLNSTCLKSSIAGLRDENSKLREMYEEGKSEKVRLCHELEKMEQMVKEKVVLENSVAELNKVLEESHDKVKTLEASCQSLQSEKASLFSEKASILYQLQAVTESMRNLLEKNAVLENSLSSAKVEVEVLREKSKGLAEICKIIKQERSYLLTERDALVSKLENVEKKHGILEKRFTGLEEKYADIEKEKESIYNQVEKLELSLALEKKEQFSLQLLSETRLVQLENQICSLREDNIRKKTEIEDEMEKAIRAQFELSILQRFMKDLEEKNYALITECQKHVDASKLAEKVISELEGESLEQQVETKLLLDEIEGLRLGIYQIFKCLAEVDSSFSEPQEKTREQSFVNHIMGSIEGMKLSISKQDDKNQQLLVENLVLLALIDQLRVKGMEVEAQNIQLEKELDIISEKFDAVCNEKEKIVEMNERLTSDLNDNHRYTAALKADLSSLSAEQDDMLKAYDVMKEAYSLAKCETADVLEKFSALKEEKHTLDQLNESSILESLKTANESEVLRSFSSEKVQQVKSVLEDLSKQEEVNNNLVSAMTDVREKLASKEMENLALKDAIRSLETKAQQMRDCNDQMDLQILIGKECLIQAESKLAEAEEKLTAAETLNSTLCSTVEALNREVYESHKIIENQEFTVNQLSEKDLFQTKEIRSLKTANLKLESELDFLRDELQEREVREQNLHCDIEEMNEEFELWEADAETFYFDLQVSSVREVLFEDKVNELTEACKNLQDDNAVKTSEVVEMKEKICSMEGEISRLKSQIEEYPRAMASLEHDVAFLERIVMLQAKVKASPSQKPAILDCGTDLQTNALLTLKDIQARVRTLCKLMEETNNSPISRRRSYSKNGYESEIDQIKPIQELNETPKLRRLKSKSSESRDRLLLKDIPLDQISNSNSLRRTHIRNKIGSDDQMLELWEAAAEDSNRAKARTSFKANGNDSTYSMRKFEPPSTDSDIEKEIGLEKSLRTAAAQEVDDGKILSKLFSDAERLEILQKTVQHLRRKFESVCKKKRTTDSVDLETVSKHLAESEDSIVQLVDFNCQLVKNMEECPAMDRISSPRAKETSKVWRMKVDEHAQKGSERIKCLQLEVQKIQYALLKIEDDDDEDGKKVKGGKNVFLRNRSVVLRDFIYNGRRKSGRRKKGHFCGCFKEQPSMSRK